MIYKLKKITLLLISIVLFSTQNTAANEIELSGLVIDRTLTRFGKDFTFYYSGYWRELPYTQGHNVTISETVFPQAGTLLVVKLNDKKIYQTHFGRRMLAVEKRAEQAMLVTIDYLAYLQAQQYNNDFDDQIDGY
ncbi:curli production assembly protein CsgE [Parashewanella curva]|uniref:Curli production assembly/transport component CsgE n=1 Tax=Parashewanella curva TaxID=2338552 RepID=A0A3L8PYX3_9GAMM|nr:curli production assembly/transport protein CsgE [Parashewanella curva]RLV60561.1 curli production assembly protein CsgE [Parashewanella curva]